MLIIVLFQDTSDVSGVEKAFMESKKIIITGQNGYISNNLKNWFMDKGEYEIVMLNLKEENWQNISFKNVECIVHTAALVHKNEKDIMQSDYDEVNVDLTQKLAEKAKREEVKHFIFMSTMAVFGLKQSLFNENIIDETTKCNPSTKYGISKYNAEKKLLEIEDTDFIVTIIRPPFVYGENCPGNYNMLKKITLKLGVVPKIENKRSMLYIKNLCEFIYIVYKNKLKGTFHPQNKEYVKTYKLCELIAKCNSRKIYLSKWINIFVKPLSIVYSPLRKAFGSEYYDHGVSDIEEKYQIVDFEESILRTERDSD